MMRCRKLHDWVGRWLLRLDDWDVWLDTRWQDFINKLRGPR